MDGSFKHGVGVLESMSGRTEPRSVVVDAERLFLERMRPYKNCEPLANRAIGSRQSNLNRRSSIIFHLDTPSQRLLLNTAIVLRITFSDSTMQSSHGQLRQRPNAGLDSDDPRRHRIIDRSEGSQICAAFR
jgi:hypothetical protein